MNRKEILSLLNMGENCEIEFKETRNYLPKSIWSSYSALANTKGGIIILGMAENGKGKYEITGINNPSYQDINKETLENYRCIFRVHKGKNHEWNKLSDNDFLKMIGAIDRKSNNLTVAGLLIFGNEEDIVKITTNYFLDYREILSTDLKERWSHRITSWDEKGWIEPNIEQLSNPDRTILKLTMKKKESRNVVENVVENVAEKLTVQEVKLLNIIMKDNNLTQSQMAEKLNISVRQVSRRLRELKEKRVIERIGSDKKGYWKIVKKS